MEVSDDACSRKTSNENSFKDVKNEQYIDKE